MADTQQWVARDFSCDQGSDWKRFIRFWQDAAKTVPVDLTGCVLSMQIREGVADSGAVVLLGLQSQTSGTVPQRIFFIADSAGVPNPAGTPNPANGWVMLKLTAAETATLRSTRAPKPRAFPALAVFDYDLELTDAAGATQRRMAGAFNLSLEVTRP